MKFVTVLAAMIFAVGAQSVSLDAQGRGQAQVKKTSTSVSTPKAKSSARAPKSTPKKTAKTNTPAAKPETRATKTATKANARAVKTTAKAEKRAVKAEATSAKNATTSPVQEPTPAPVLTTTFISPETPTTHSVKNAKLEARLLPLLPAGITVQDASQGFKNWGQFVAAVHVSSNLGIPFADLKTRMTGIAPGAVPGSSVQTAPMSLGQAIQSFKGATATGETGILSPTRINNEVKKAEDAANSDLRRTREAS